MKYLVANWKAQMTLPLIQEWIHTFNLLVQGNTTLAQALQNNQITIIICPPFPFILYLKKHIVNSPGIAIGSQTLSVMDNGKYTGEVTAQTLEGMASYSIIGHSERRLHMNETEAMIDQQIQQAKKYHIKQILCVRNDQDTLYDGAFMVAYEPTGAIGTGANAAIDDVLSMKKQLSLPRDVPFLYGGSADSSNITGYLKSNEVDGFLVGTASLKANSFAAMAAKMLEE